MCIRDSIYYLGDEDDGARKSGWLWLEKPDDDNDDISLCPDGDDCLNCDEEGWYWFAKDGKVYRDAKQKKIDGKYYYFNEHGQMLYNWIIASTSGTTTKDDDKNYKDNEDCLLYTSSSARLMRNPVPGPGMRQI